MSLFRAATVGVAWSLIRWTKSIGGQVRCWWISHRHRAKFDWSDYPTSARLPCGDQGWGRNSARKACGDMAALSNHAAHQLALGAETWRCAYRTSATALTLAQWLEQHPAIARVLYPMLPSHPHMSRRAGTRRGSWLLWSFELRDSAVPAKPACGCPSRRQGWPTTRNAHHSGGAASTFGRRARQCAPRWGLQKGNAIRLSVGLKRADLLAD